MHIWDILQIKYILQILYISKKCTYTYIIPSGYLT
jgi:hypothetical protein